MKKNVLILMLTVSGMAQAQSGEPEEITTDGMIETIDRKDIEADDNGGVKPDNSLPKFDIPLIEFNENDFSPTDESKSVDGKTENTKSTSVPKIIIAEKPLSLTQLRKNDKIVVSESGMFFAYRLVNNEITQYRLIKAPDLQSGGVMKKGENSYYVVNKSLLIRDSKNSGNQDEVEDDNDSVAGEGYIPSQQELEDRKKIEKDYNNGRKIKKSLLLKNLRINDEVYIFGDVQLVFRLQKSTSRVKKYWLVEKLDIENPSVVKEGNGKYKIIRFITPES